MYTSIHVDGSPFAAQAKLAWYAENQELVTKSDLLVSEQQKAIALLEARVLEHGAGAGMHTCGYLYWSMGLGQVGSCVVICSENAHAEHVGPHHTCPGKGTPRGDTLRLMFHTVRIA